KDLETAKAELELFCINPFKEGTGIRWGIVRKGSSGLIGTCGYYDWSKTSRRAEIGYDLDPAYWGQGIMTEALMAVIEYGFQEMGLNRIQAIIDSKNKRSINLVQRLDFKKEGVLRQRSYFRERFLDDVCFSILRKEWGKSFR
ncbi:MAG: GNAT family N-acetyltransferase, partial [Promethearchaeota archaeon]